MIDNNNYCNNNDWLSVQYPPLFASASVNDYCSIYPFIWKGLFIMGTRGQAIQSELLNYEILLHSVFADPMQQLILMKGLFSKFLSNSRADL